MLQFDLGMKKAAAEFLHDFLSAEEVRLGMYRSDHGTVLDSPSVTDVNVPETQTAQIWDSSCIRPQNKPRTETQEKRICTFKRNQREVEVVFG